MKKIFLIVAFVISQIVSAQNKELKFNFNDDGSHYLKATFTGQVWLRETDNNSGTYIGTNNSAFTENQTFDIGVRRARAQVYGKVSDKVFVYTQIGTNNMSYNAGRKQSIFFHDVVTEYYVTPRALQIGGGLTSWNGLARYSSLAIASYVGFDGPIYQQSTNDATDQFFRKYSVYAKGKVGKLDYRLNLSKPMIAQAASQGVINALSANSDFSLKPPKLQFAGYFMYQFLEEESNLIPFMSGSYLGKKKVFNIGAGFQYQADAMWHTSSIGDTVTNDMLNYNVDVFYDHPLGTKGASLTLYGAYTHFGFGPKYLRYNGVMNPSTGALIGGVGLGGNAFPMYGTGDVFYGQIAYLLPQTILGEKGGQLQPYADIMYAKYDRLNDKMMVWEAGFNWLIEGNRSKISLGYQDRPIFNTPDLRESTRKGMIVLAYQIAI